MSTAPPRTQRLSAGQLRRLHALWHVWSSPLGLRGLPDRTLRHYYVWLFSGRQFAETRLLSPSAARSVLRWLEKLVAARNAAARQAAGTAGREGFPEQRRVRPDSSAWRALWACAHALGITREQLDAFIERHYAALGLHATSDLRTMADLNRVLWGLKAILRRGPRSEAATRRARAA